MKKIFIPFLILCSNNILPSIKSPQQIPAKTPPSSTNPLQRPQSSPQPQQPISYPAPKCSTVHQSNFSTPPPLKLPSPELKPQTPAHSTPLQPLPRSVVSTATQCEAKFNLNSPQGILYFLKHMFNPDSPFPLMKIQSSRINDMVKLQLLVYFGQKSSRNCFEYTNVQNTEFVQCNPKKTSIFTEPNEQQIIFPQNFYEEIFQILKNSKLNMPPEMIQTCLSIIKAQKEGLLLREQQGTIRFIP